MNEKISLKVLMSVIAAGIMSFSGVVIETSMNITFPTLMKDFNIDTSTVQWMTTIYLLIVSVVVPLSAILKQNFKTKPLFITANVLFILGILIDLFAQSFTLLLIGRIVQGLGTGIALPLMFNIILEQVPSKKIGLMMGVGNLITAIAPAVGPTFGGIVVSSIGWRYIFLILLPILIISLLMGSFSIEQKSNIQHNKLDFLSLLLIVITFAGLVYGFSSMGSGSIISINVLIPIIIGLIAIIALYKRSVNIDNPIVNLSILKNTKFSGHVVAFFILQFITLGMSFILPNYVQIVNKQSAFVAGLIVLPGAALGAVFAPLAGKIMDKVGAYKPIFFGMFAGLIGLLLFTIFGTHLSNTMILVFYLVYMLCLGLSFGNIMTSGLSMLNANDSSDGNAIFNTIQQISGAISTSIISAVVAISQMNPNYSKQLGTAIGSEHGFILLIILLLLAAIILNKVVRRAK
ncbi:MFS transporter [Apilactobacillus timberlakei]|uniref:DHA2 family efflux MFS transporter permease subunit n=1 Tax=Apilactobacillus timberlakei TaxID=2008380 RepID=UPI0011286166|nr:DHA2 family efflux MFS transporter permease subunit [Apilactobacillus timberlakei]TPR18763.1 MFS transporter [Apilactobacillus timberlakei]TPR21072.1 MFS transporter [Apilactobacillus timberlakei]TPR23723.1 MFS transporter [Apilactobacillus timberlakei]TPR25073.1 MFS transporter [Apilactobacillus timberlakei]